ncbi:MAG: DUF4349 domain-containing protein [Chloroflexia bacterium]
MDRSNVNRYLDRLKSIQTRRRNRLTSASAPRTGIRPGRKASILIVLSVLACMALTMFSAVARPNGSSAWLSDKVMAMPTTAAAMEGITDANLAYGMAGQPQAAPAAGGDARGQTTTSSPPSTGGAAQVAQNWDRMIIRTATLQLKVKDVPESLDRVRALAGTHGGYIASSESHIEGEYTVATLTLQVPAAQFDDAMTELRKVGLKAIGENVSSSDVTEEYTDLQSQLKNLRATEGRIQALMGRAERIEDILTLDRELRQIQSEIERIVGRTNYLSKRAEMSSITVTLYPEVAVVEPVKLTEEGWNPGRIASEAWNASLEMLSNIATVAITVAVFMWWAVPLLLLALWLALRPRRDIPSGSTSTPAPDAA